MRKSKPDLCETCVREKRCDRSPAHRFGSVIGEKGWRVWGCMEHEKDEV